MFSQLQRIFRRRHRVRTPAAERGAAGERRAACFLAERDGLSIVARNWRNPHERRQEIDLVCRDGDVLVFVEVKTRSAGARVRGYRSVDRRKRRALRRAVLAYLAQLRVRPRTFRFDVAEVVTGDGIDDEVRHFVNVPLFPRRWRW